MFLFDTRTFAPTPDRRRIQRALAMGKAQVVQPHYIMTWRTAGDFAISERRRRRGRVRGRAGWRIWLGAGHEAVMGRHPPPPTSSFPTTFSSSQADRPTDSLAETRVLHSIDLQVR